METDDHSVDQFVMVEYSTSRATSPSVFSEWSIDGLVDDSAARGEEALADALNRAEQAPREEHAAIFNNDDRCLDTSGDCSPFSAVDAPSSSSTSSGNQRLLPDSSKEIVFRRNEQLPSILMIPVSSCEAKARRLTRNCRIHLATLFDGAASSPEEHFEARTVPGGIPHRQRYVNRRADQEIMLVTDGSCMFTGSVDSQGKSSECEPSAGASFIYKPSFSHADMWAAATISPFQMNDKARRLQWSASGKSQIRLTMPAPAGKIGLRLEVQGPNGDVQRHTSNRAKLRAVIAALDFCPWYAEGWKRVVVVTDLEYIALGATQWVALWAKRRWRSAPSWTKEGKMRLGKKIANRDLWEELQSRIDILREHGTEVSFWLVQNTSNSSLLREAKAAARDAARMRPDTVVVEEYTKLIGENV